MADIELVIKIPDYIVESVKNSNICPYEKFKIYDAIKNGTPLPKRHGRLIDADKFNTVLFQYKEDTFCNGMQMMLERIDNAPTIIGADKAESEE